jgi:glycosyltransferase involved in cell wall biosynthesis
VPLDIIILHPSRTPRGGIVNAALAQAVALLRRGHRTELWTASAEVAARAAALGIPVLQDAGLSSPLRAVTSPRVLAALIHARRRKVDAVIHQGARLRLPLRAVAPATRQFVVFHNEKLGGRRRFRNWIALTRRHAAELKALARSDGLERHVAAVPNALLAMPAAAPPPASLMPLRLGVLAELRPQKGVHLLLEALHRLAKEGIPFVLNIGGAGPERERLEAQTRALGLEREVRWHGWVEDLDAFFARFDVLCLPSLSEPFGLVVIEAMARGKIVVASATDGPVEIIAHGETGYLFPPGDGAALADRLRTILAEPRAALAVAASGRAHVLRTYAPEAIGARLEACIAEAVAL